MTEPVLGRLSVGDAAPDFSLPSDTGETVKLQWLKDRFNAGVALVYYPHEFTVVAGASVPISKRGREGESRKASGQAVWCGLQTGDISL